MTFKATSLNSEDRKLILRSPLRPIGEPVRRLLVTVEINELLDGKKEFGVFPDVEAEKLIGRFIAGHVMHVSRKKTKRKPDIESIEGEDEIWALCARRPRPGWRLLGRFVEKNLFVALRAYSKEDLFGKYSEASKAVAEDWKKYFDERKPHSSKDLIDYLGEQYYDTDQEI